MIIAMKKARIVALKEDKEKLLESLQRYGEVMLISPNTEKTVADVSEVDLLWQRTEKSLALLQKYKAKEKGFREQFEVEYPTFASTNPNQEKMLTTVEKADEEITLLNQENQNLQDKIAFFLPWIQLDERLSDLDVTKQAVVRTGTIEIRNLEELKNLISEAGGEIQILSSTGVATLIYVVFREDDKAVFEKAKNVGFNEVSLPKEPKLVSEIVSVLEKSVTKNQKRLDELKAILSECAKSSQEIELLSDQAGSISRRNKAELMETADTIYLEGWVRNDRLDRLSKAITEVTEFFDLELVDPAPGEIPPTVTKNNRFVDAYEMITDMFSKPNPYEVDPNPVMSIWYWIIFGMMMGDAGYGVIMIGLIYFLIKKMKPKGNSLRLFRVLFYGGFSTVIWGVLFGSYFGFTWNPILLEPMNQPMELLIFSIILGVCHIITGLLMKAYHNFRDKNYMAVFADSFSWICILIGIGMLFLPSTAEIGKWVALFGAAVVIFFAGRSVKNPIGRVGLGMYTLYGISSYLGDILSYSRILALSLSSAVLAMVMNMLAQMVSGSVIGFFFGMIIFLVGHLFNLAMGLLSAFVHASRLQYIEFFGKFYEGGGIFFTPLEMQLKHVDVLKDTINQ